MLQERVMNKASETRNINIREEKWCKLFQYLKMSSFDHPNTIMAICPTVSGNRDT